MLMPDFHIRSIEIEDLDAVVRIHRASFDDRALTQLGNVAVRRYYHWLLTGFAEIYPICAETKMGELAGFCFSGVYAGSFSGFLRKNKWYLVGNMLLRPWLVLNPLIRDQSKLALSNLRTLFKYLKKIKFNDYQDPEGKLKMGSSFGILSIAVDPAHQRRGIAGLLMSEVEKYASENGYSQLYLSVHPENLPAVKFYEKMGWQRALADGKWGGKMFKNLD